MNTMPNISGYGIRGANSIQPVSTTPVHSQKVQRMTTTTPGVILDVTSGVGSDGTIQADPYKQIYTPGAVPGMKDSSEDENKPCQACQNRVYIDQSNDGGVSFKGGGKIAPGAAASVVMSHEREHVAIAQREALSKNSNVQTSVRIHTDVCPECKKVYVSGGMTEVRVTTPAQAKNTYKKPDQALGKNFDKAA
ncbi:MAG: hypothetical protein FWH04_01715 [Oscillospiraceae bacterium]|nr:hypothetical protein [Oscillospiraceae bacterium]